MTKEEKQLLLKDLCPRLPYGVYVDAYSWQKDTPKLLVECVPEYVGAEIVTKRLAGRHSIREIKPYLRPMSSMTEEEKKVVCSMNMISDTELNDRLNYQRMYVQNYTIETFDLFNAHHFDYRGLIEKGLALEAPEGMYKTKLD